jgi:CBS domain containing-hemolysin-like protein
MSTQSAIWLGLVLLIGNAFFVGAEFALVSARRTKVEPKAAEGSRVARTTLRAMEGLSQMIAAAQLGITVCSLGLGAVAEPALAHLIEPLAEAVNLPDAWLHPVAFTLAMVCVVYLHVVLGEMVPKNLALAGPERAAFVLGPPMVAIVTVLKPIVYGLDAVANSVVRLLKVEPRTEVISTFTLEEV